MYAQPIKSIDSLLALPLQWFAPPPPPTLPISSEPPLGSEIAVAFAVRIVFDFATATEVLRSLAWLICRCSRFTSSHFFTTVRTYEYNEIG